MTIEVVCGINWGDEGKGRMVDYLAMDADIVCRYQGGNNAGHTIVNEFGTFQLHLIPSGICNPKTINILGPGTVIHLEALMEELISLQKDGISIDNFKISDRATICFPFHVDEDGWEEERLSKKAYGSTKRGIAPCYGDRYVKKSIQIGELLYPDYLKERLKQLYEWKSLVAKGVYQKEMPYTYEDILNWTMEFGEKIRPYICDTTELFKQATKENKKIVFEAQLGALRDIFYGIYPFTTSSSPLATFAAVGSGLFQPPDRITGVMKAFSTCVGAGPFVTEWAPAEADPFRKTAQEFGASTGRPRRIGHFDAVASRYGALIQNATEIAITKLDNLSGQKRLQICTHYEVQGKQIQNFPLNALLEKAHPIYIEMEGWEEDISQCRHFENLPLNAQNYVLKIEELIECPIRYVSVGPEREALIIRP